MNILNALAQHVELTLAVPATNTSTLTGTGVDVTDWEGVAVCVLNSAAGTGTTPTLDGKIQHCDTVGGTYADVSGATFTQITDAGDAMEAIAVNVSNTKGFLRFVGTIAGTTPSFVCGAVILGVKKAS